MMHVVLVTELLAIYLCIHCIYDRKIKWNLKIVGTFLGILIILEMANYYHLGGGFSLLAYVVFILYYLNEFKCRIIEAIISFLLCMIIITTLQFASFSLVDIVVAEEIVRDIIGSILLLVICVLVLPKCGLHKLYKCMCERSKYVILLVAFMGIMVAVILLQGKTFMEVQVQYFVLGVPAIGLLLYSILKWYATRLEVESVENELRIAEETKEDYEDLLTKVRLRQHEFKNHIAAVFSSHYTYKTYEKLVSAQEYYCKKLLDENKYNSLLLLGDKVLVGYLYGKFQEIETDDIEVKYKVSAALNQSCVPTYYVIEMLGILLDNATEAIKDFGKKVVVLEIVESEKYYEFSVMNPYRYVSCDEILEWFKFGKTEKGRERGLGLYHLKCTCEEWKCEIGCRNIEIEQMNWIVFVLKIRKVEADNK